MKTAIACALVIASVTTASAQSLGSYDEGAARAQELALQERALELDSRDSGDSDERMRRQQELDEVAQLLKRNNELLEQSRRDRLTRGQ